MNRVLHPIGVVLLVCIGVRVADLLIASLLPTIVSIFVLVAILCWLLLSFRVRT
jgi:hypothetical protein